MLLVLNLPNTHEAKLTVVSFQVPATPKRPRTAEDFYHFCKLVLEYEGYDNQKAKEVNIPRCILSVSLLYLNTS